MIHRPPSPAQSLYTLLGRQNIVAEEVKYRMSVRQARQARYYNSWRKVAHFQQDDIVRIKTRVICCVKLAEQTQSSLAILSLKLIDCKLL